MGRLIFGAIVLLTLTAFLCDDDDSSGSDPPPLTGSGREACLEVPFNGQLIHRLPLEVKGEQNLDYDLTLTVDGSEVARFNEPSAVVDASGLSGCTDHWTRGFAHSVAELGDEVHEVQAVSVSPNGRAGISTIYFAPGTTDAFIAYFETDEVEVAPGEIEQPCYRFFEENDLDSYQFSGSASIATIRPYRAGFVNDPTSWSTRAYSDRQCNISVAVAAGTAPGHYQVDVVVTSQSRAARPSQTMTITVVVPGSSTPSSSTPPSSVPPPPAPIDVSGIWTFDITVTDACEPEPPYNRVVTITQSGNSLKVRGLGDGNEAWAGAIEGDHVSFGGDRAEDKGTTTAEFVMTVDSSGQKMSGLEDWSWTDGTLSCPQGFSDVEANRTG